MLTAAFPSGVLGPVDFNALRRFASICLMVAISFIEQAKPIGRCVLKEFRAVPTALSALTISRRGWELDGGGMEFGVRCFVLRSIKNRKLA